MKLNNIGYLLKEGFRSIFQHGFMSFAAICVTVACLIIVGSFSALAYNLDIMVQDLNKTSEILVYIDSSLSDAEARSIGTKINLLDNVLEAKFVSREEALQNFVSDHDNDSAFSGVQAQDLRHRYVVTLEDNTKMQQTAELLLQLPGVDKINAAYELAEGFTTIQSVLHIVSVAVIAVLLVVSLLIISNTVKLAMQGENPPSNASWTTPVSGYTITSPFGMRTHPILGTQRMHNGIDMACNQGTPIYATRAGTVTVASYQAGGAGYYVSINHLDGFASIYMHMTNYVVSAGQSVSQGQLIGYVGSTGLSTGPHLHFGISYAGTYVNPLAYIL